MVSSPEFIACAKSALVALAPLVLEGAARRDKTVVTKRDGSLVTALDQEIEARLVAIFRQAFPNVPILGEEGAIDSEAQSAEAMYRQFLDAPHQIVIDPIDGTRNFIEGNPRYCIAVALSSRRDHGVWPTTGVIAIPEERGVYWCDEDSVIYEDLVSGEQQPVTWGLKSEAPVSVNSRDRSWLAANKLQLAFPWVSTGSSVYDFVGSVIGRNRASIVGSQRLWDLMAPLALALRSGLVLRDLQTGHEVSSITIEDLSTDVVLRPWGLSRKMFLARPDFELSELLHRAS